MSAPRVVLTGGPGAGKTAVLELVRRAVCRHVRVLPEAASVVYGGGFPRESIAHPRRIEIAAAHDFLTKARHALDAIRAELPPCPACGQRSGAPGR